LRGVTATVTNEIWGVFTWQVYINEINHNRPVMLGVDSNGDGMGDHAIVGIGYNMVTHQYAAYNTWDQQVHWYTFEGTTTGEIFGIFDAVLVTPT